MLVDSKLYKISENLFLNVQVILSNQNIILKMQDINEILQYVQKNFFNGNNATKIAYNIKLDSGLDIKAYYEITHNPVYLALIYKEYKCCSCDVLPQKLIIKILNRNSSLNNLSRIKLINFDKNIDDNQLNLAQKLAKSINKKENVKLLDCQYKASIISKPLKEIFTFSNNIAPSKFADEDIVMNKVDQTLITNTNNSIQQDINENNNLLQVKNVNISTCLDSKTCNADTNFNKELNSNEIHVNSLHIHKSIVNFSEKLRKNKLYVEDKFLKQDESILKNINSTNTEEKLVKKEIVSSNFLINECKEIINVDTFQNNIDLNNKIESNKIILPNSLTYDLDVDLDFKPVSLNPMKRKKRSLNSRQATEAKVRLGASKNDCCETNSLNDLNSNTESAHTSNVDNLNTSINRLVVKPGALRKKKKVPTATLR